MRWGGGVGNSFLGKKKKTPWHSFAILYQRCNLADNAKKSFVFPLAF